MRLENIAIDLLEYKDSKLYIYYRNYYGDDKYFNKVFCFKNVKSFTYTLEELAHMDETDEYLQDLGIKFFTRVIYRNKKRKKLYIFDANFSITIIEFNEEKEWNYREQKK